MRRVRAGMLMRSRQGCDAWMRSAAFAMHACGAAHMHGALASRVQPNTLCSHTKPPCMQRAADAPACLIGADHEDEPHALLDGLVGDGGRGERRHVHLALLKGIKRLGHRLARDAVVWDNANAHAGMHTGRVGVVGLGLPPSSRHPRVAREEDSGTCTPAEPAHPHSQANAGGPPGRRCGVQPPVPVRPPPCRCPPMFLKNAPQERSTLVGSLWYRSSSSSRYVMEVPSLKLSFSLLSGTALGTAGSSAAPTPARSPRDHRAHHSRPGTKPPPLEAPSDASRFAAAISAIAARRRRYY